MEKQQRIYNKKTAHSSQHVVIVLREVELERLVLEGVELSVSEQAVSVGVVDAEEPAQGSIEPGAELLLLCGVCRREGRQKNQEEPEQQQ